MFRWVDGSFGGRLRAKRRYSMNEISDIMIFIVHQYDTIAVLFGNIGVQVFLHCEILWTFGSQDTSLEYASSRFACALHCFF